LGTFTTLSRCEPL